MHTELPQLNSYLRLHCNAREAEAMSYVNVNWLLHHHNVSIKFVIDQITGAIRNGRLIVKLIVVIIMFTITIIFRSALFVQVGFVIRHNQVVCNDIIIFNYRPVSHVYR